VIYKPDWFNSTGNGETIFKNWFVSVMRGQHWHVQEFEDRRHIGIPDLSGANQGQEAWLELKVAKKFHSVHDYLHLDYGVTAQQHRWLLDRSVKSAAICGIVVAWRTGTKTAPVEEYCSFVPIGLWRTWLNKMDLMTWGLAPFTASVRHLITGGDPVMAMLRQELTPGRSGVVSATRAPVGVPEQLG
jgi:hypothetical protein